MLRNLGKTKKMKKKVYFVPTVKVKSMELTQFIAASEEEEYDNTVTGITTGDGNPDGMEYGGSGDGTGSSTPRARENSIWEE